MGSKSSEDEVEGGESDEGVNPTIDAGLKLPLVFTPFNCMSFGGVVGGDNVFPLVPGLPTLGGRDGGLTIGARVADKFLECRFGFSQSARRRLRSTLSNRPCMPGMAPAVVGSDSSPPPFVPGEGRWRQQPSLDRDLHPHRHHPNPKRCRRLGLARPLSSPVCLYSQYRV